MTTTLPTFKLIWGAKAIAQTIDRDPRAVFSMLEKGLLPAKKVGRRWVAQEALLRRAFGEDQASGEGK